jgi:predicted regulator of Ras-like GTPase activity (Roadblock/LC7/MglB family)
VREDLITELRQQTNAEWAGVVTRSGLLIELSPAADPDAEPSAALLPSIEEQAQSLLQHWGNSELQRLTILGDKGILVGQHIGTRHMLVVHCTRGTNLGIIQDRLSDIAKRMEPLL